MTRETIFALLKDVQQGGISPENALGQLADLPFEDAEFVKIDHHRTLRLGLPEVIFAAGKTRAQVAEIFLRMANSGSDVLATRADQGRFNAVRKVVPAAEYHAEARIITLRQEIRNVKYGPIAVICAGTSDIPVAEEAAVTAEFLGTQVQRVYDVGVAGLHRLLAQLETLQQVQVAIVCAGMEGALPSVVGGLVGAPVIAVPTSVGYGASFGGVAALLGMLNTCSPNIAVVNIDNGFGAAYISTMIVRSIARAHTSPPMDSHAALSS
jgi:NCAIR mutase (PurE)-related protein